MLTIVLWSLWIYANKAEHFPLYNFPLARLMRGFSAVRKWPQAVDILLHTYIASIDEVLHPYDIHGERNSPSGHLVIMLLYPLVAHILFILLYVVKNLICSGWRILHHSVTLLESFLELQNVMHVDNAVHIGFLVVPSAVPRLIWEYQQRSLNMPKGIIYVHKLLICSSVLPC